MRELINKIQKQIRYIICELEKIKTSISKIEIDNLNL